MLKLNLMSLLPTNVLLMTDLNTWGWRGWQWLFILFLRGRWGRRLVIIFSGIFSLVLCLSSLVSSTISCSRGLVFVSFGGRIASRCTIIITVINLVIIIVINSVVYIVYGNVTISTRCWLYTLRV